MGLGAGVNQGLSPLTRGNQHRNSLLTIGNGPIPAHAGEPSLRCLSFFVLGAYPRSRGGTSAIAPSGQALWGLSPLTRGNHCTTHTEHPGPGPIPAHAGEPLPSRTRYQPPWAYPRSRGGTHPEKRASWLRRGLSPLTRGNHVVMNLDNGFPGPIPAHAGEPSVVSKHMPGSRAYPRSRGGTRSQRRQLIFALGLSPLTRGNHRRLSPFLV